MGETDTHSVAAGDVDGDGEIDLVFGNGQWPLRTQGADKLLLNTGDGVFGTGFWIDPRLTSGRVPECVVLADIDADGDLDLVCSYRNGPRTTPIVFENLGSGRFLEARDRFFPRGVHSTQFLAVADMDGDLDLDLVGYESPNRQAGTPARLWVYYNEGGAYTSFRPVRCFVPPKVGSCSGITLADLDGDSRLDILMLNWKSRDQLFLRSGAGGFVDATIKNLPLSRHLNTTSAVTGDVDGDGDQDIVFGVDDGPNRLC